MSNTPTPKGVVACFIDEKGHVVESANCFAPDKPAGYTLAEAQKRRAEIYLSGAVARAYCSPAYVRGISDYDLGRIIDNLCRKHGCKIHYEYIGHEGEEE